MMHQNVVAVLRLRLWKFLVVPEPVKAKAVQLLQAEGEHAWIIGHVAERAEHEEAVEIRS